MLLLPHYALPVRTNVPCTRRKLYRVSYSGANDGYCPTEKQIRDACLEIQREWSDETRRLRRMGRGEYDAEPFEKIKIRVCRVSRRGYRQWIAAKKLTCSDETSLG